MHSVVMNNKLQQHSGAYSLNVGLAVIQCVGEQSLVEIDEVSSICLTPRPTCACHARRPHQPSVHQHDRFLSVVTSFNNHEY